LITSYPFKINSPHIDHMLIVFFKGTCKKWVASIEELSLDLKISKMTVEEKALAFCSPTDNYNEGVCTRMKQWSR